MTPSEWATKLHAAVPWIPESVFTAWVTQENVGGSYGTSQNNPLGITVSGGVSSFPTPQAGANATASLLASSLYKNIKATSEATGGSIPAIIQAIGQSPWNECHYQGGSLAAGCASQPPGHTLMATWANLFIPSGSGGSPLPGDIGLLPVAPLAPVISNIGSLPSSVWSGAGAVLSPLVPDVKSVLPYVLLIGGLAIASIFLLKELGDKTGATKAAERAAVA